METLGEASSRWAPEKSRPVSAGGLESSLAALLAFWWWKLVPCTSQRTNKDVRGHQRGAINDSSGSLSSASATFQYVLTTDALMSSSALQKGQHGVWGVVWLFPETFDLSH